MFGRLRKHDSKEMERDSCVVLFSKDVIFFTIFSFYIEILAMCAQCIKNVSIKLFFFPKNIFELPSPRF
jgi:hypothetical protein